MNRREKMLEYLKNGRLIELAMKLRTFGASSDQQVKAVEQVKSGKSIVNVLAEVGLASEMEMC